MDGRAPFRHILLRPGKGADALQMAFRDIDEMEKAARNLGVWDGFARHEPGRFVVRLALPPDDRSGGESLPDSILGIVDDTVENAGRLHELGIRLRF